MNKKQRKNLIRIIVAVVLTIALTLVFRFIKVNELFKLLYLIPYLIVGYDILRKAVKGIFKKQVFDENFLMAIASIGAFILGDYLESAAVMIMYQIGELFESYAVGKSRKNITELMDIRPDYANLLQEDKSTKKVDPFEVEVGDVIVVNPGEKVPIDGIVIEGKSSLDTVALTGESVPRSINVGEEIISGCINLGAVLKVKTTKEFDESTVSKILELVENSSMKKAKAENFISKFAKYYTPIVCYLALALAVLPPIALTAMGRTTSIGDWIFRALTFLVISCPCALVISVPLSFFGGVGCASSNGILIKGSNYMEVLSKVKTIVFDKTGTLTQGVFQVTKIHEEEGFEDKVLEYAAYAENASSHPIAVSIKEAFARTLDMTKVSETLEIAGHGVETIYDGKKISVGNVKLMARYGINIEKSSDQTMVYVMVDGAYAGYIAISDKIKENSPKTISDLKEMGIKSVILTGDAHGVAKSVAEKLGVDRFEAGLLPDQKVMELERILEEKNDDESVAFVGDGINDAPVITRADIGMAMGSMGSDAAIEAADIVLMDDNPKNITLAIKIAKKTIKIVYENIIFAIAVKVACLLLGALGLANMWMAIFADVGVMIIAVINAMRALKIDKRG